jgi:hypothetical protein
MKNLFITLILPIVLISCGKTNIPPTTPSIKYGIMTADIDGMHDTLNGAVARNALWDTVHNTYYIQMTGYAGNSGTSSRVDVFISTLGKNIIDSTYISSTNYIFAGSFTNYIIGDYIDYWDSSYVTNYQTQLDPVITTVNISSVNDSEIIGTFSGDVDTTTGYNHLAPVKRAITNGKFDLPVVSPSDPRWVEAAPFN